MKVIFEIGCHNGYDIDNFLKDYPDSIVYAIEPCQETLVKYLWTKYNSNPRVKVCPFAIDIENSFKNFKVSVGDGACSSLHDFTDGVSDLWRGREDFSVSKSYSVPTITLKDFCNLYNINNIDILDIDTQGNDFNCLLSLGDKIDIVQSGQCETAYNIELYKNTNNHVKLVEPWLKEKGFNVKVEPMAPIDNPECNIFFKRL